MADDLIDNLNQPSESEKRINQLSNKVKEEATAKENALKEVADAKRETTFYKDFSRISGKYQGATDFIDDIKSKVMAGYDPEDATVAVLNKAGKLTTPPPTAPAAPVAPVDTGSPAGGSADTILPTGQKAPSAMTQEERRKVLETELLWS